MKSLVLLLAGFGSLLLFFDVEKNPARMLEESDLIGKKAPEFARGEWINSDPLRLSDLRGRVVMLEFWTYGCYNCRNTLPYIKKMHDRFEKDNVTIIGIHTPEFETEKVLANVKKQVKELGIRYPVVTDNEYETWNAYNQQYWPVIYIVDKRGIVRYCHIGEGAYHETEATIKRLLEEKA